MPRCVYLNIDHSCQLFDPDWEDDELGCDDEGYCNVYDDPDPTVGCSSYEDVERM